MERLVAFGEIESKWMTSLLKKQKINICENLFIFYIKENKLFGVYLKKKIYAYKKYSEREKIYKCERDGWCDDGEKTPILVIQTKILL